MEVVAAGLSFVEWVGGAVRRTCPSDGDPFGTIRSALQPDRSEESVQAL